jgi:hypothetical protein
MSYEIDGSGSGSMRIVGLARQAPKLALIDWHLGAKLRLSVLESLWSIASAYACRVYINPVLFRRDDYAL